MSKARLFIVFFLVLSSSVFGWQEGVAEYFPLKCAGFPKRGAEQLSLRITAESGSYGIPYLIGIKNNAEIWALPFPADEVNLAKFDFSCNASTITLSSTDPGPNVPNKQIFSFKNGLIYKHLQFRKGSNFGEVYKKLAKGAEDHYLLQVKAGQEMKVSIDNRYPAAIFSVFEPKSATAIEETEYKYNRHVWSGFLKRSGEYSIVVKGVSDELSYYLKVEVN